MEWYVAKMVYQVVNSKKSHTPQIDEQYKLIQADDRAWAWEKATILGKLGECKLEGVEQGSVQWKFIHIVDLLEIGELKDGVELFSDTDEPENIEEYMAVSELRAKRVMETFNNQLIAGETI